jgi:hypothetical protein
VLARGLGHRIGRQLSPVSIGTILEGSFSKHRGGLKAVLSALGKNIPDEDEYVDGETIANDWIRQRTALDFTEDFWKVQYALFKLS